MHVFNKKPLASSNLDMFTYVNSKFIFLERHIRTQMETLHKEIMTQKYNLRRELYETQLAVGINHPDEFVKLFMKKEGYTALKAGEVVHIIQCQAVEVSFRGIKGECYDDLPVNYNNNSMFMTSGNRILKSVGKPIKCSDILPSMYQLNGKLYGVYHILVEMPSPGIFNPETADEWKYSPINSLITTGIYTYQDITNFNKMVLFQLDGRSIMETVAHRAGYGNQAQINQGLILDDMVSEEKIFKTVGNWWKKGTGYLNSFGTFSAGFIGIYWIFKIPEWAFDTFYLGSILFDLHGFSWRLIAGFWDSLRN
jgi:hypothetical protein